MSSPTVSCSASHNSSVSTPAPCHSEQGWACLDGARSVPERILLWFGAVFDLLQQSWIKACGWDFLVLLLKQKIPVVQGKETFHHVGKDVAGQKVISALFTFIALEEANPFVLCFSFPSDGVAALVWLHGSLWMCHCCVHALGRGPQASVSILSMEILVLRRMWSPSAAFLKILQLVCTWQNDQTVLFLEKSAHPQNQCHFSACPVHLSFTSVQVTVSWSEPLVSSVVWYHV